MSVIDDLGLGDLFSGLGDFANNNQGLIQLGAAGLGALLGNNSSGAQTTTNSSGPSALQLPYLTQALQGAQSLYNAGPLKPYPNSTVAPLSQVTTDALNKLANPGNADPYKGIQAYLQSQIAKPGTAQAVDGVDNGEKGYLQDVLKGDYLGANPYLDATFDRIKRGVQSQADSQFASGGRLNSGAAQRALTSSLGDAATSLYGGNYLAERANQGAAASGLAGISNRAEQLGVGNANRQLASDQFNRNYGLSASQQIGAQQDNVLNTYGQQASAGNVLDNYGQRVLDDSVSRYRDEQLAPYESLQRYLQNIGGNYGSTSSSRQPQNSTLNTIGGALTGAQLAASLFKPGNSGAGVLNLPGTGGGFNFGTGGGIFGGGNNNNGLLFGGSLFG